MPKNETFDVNAELKFSRVAQQFNIFKFFLQKKNLIKLFLYFFSEDFSNISPSKF